MSKYEELIQRAKNSSEYLAIGLMNDFAVYVEKNMHKSKMSQKELADILNVSEAYISKVLRGDKNLSIKTMSKFAYAFGVRHNTRETFVDFEARDKYGKINVYISEIMNDFKSKEALTTKSISMRPTVEMYEEKNYGAIHKLANAA